MRLNHQESYVQKRNELINEAYECIHNAHYIFKKQSLDRNSLDIKEIQRIKEVERITAMLASMEECIYNFITKEEPNHDIARHSTRNQES